MKVIFHSNPQQVFLTDIHGNPVANISIGANGVQQHPATPPEKSSAAPRETVPDHEPKQRGETPQEASSEAHEESSGEVGTEASAKPIRLADNEMNALHLLRQAGILNKHYQFCTDEEVSQNSKLRLLTTGERVMVAKILGERFDQPHVRRYCKDFWQLDANKQTLNSALYKFRTEQEARALAFEKEIGEILSLMNRGK